MWFSFLAAVMLSENSATPSNQTVTVVDLRSVQALASKLAVQACAGLLNRRQRAAYVVVNSYDVEWLADTPPFIPSPVFTSIPTFLEVCLHEYPSWIRYNLTSQQAILPNIITLAGVLNAVPLEEAPASISTTLIFDAVAELGSASALEATEYVYEHFVNQTTGMAKVNPGLDVHGHPFDPPLTGQPDTNLVDFLVKQRLFTFFLDSGCIPGTRAHALMSRMVTNNPWPRPIPVYGYDDSFPIAGDLFEAETDCVKQHNLGQIASSGVSNLAYFSSSNRIETPVPQNPQPVAAPYNSSRTYVTLIAGDGDNLAFVRGSRREWMKDRVHRCASDPSPRGCFPLVWTLSPHTLHAAPDWLHWYYNKSYATQQDWFVLPPSGDLYAYPSMMQPPEQAAFVKNTERDCELMNTSGVVSWEFATYWTSAIKSFFPRYADRRVVRGLFPVNVPYMIPILPFALHPEQQYILVGEQREVVLFKPDEWRGSGTGPGMSNATATAEEINSAPRGSVKHFYVTSDGGANLDLIYKMVGQLQLVQDGGHVEVVNHERLVQMAAQRG